MAGPGRVSAGIAAFVLAIIASSCEPTLVAGTYRGSGEGGADGRGGAGGAGGASGGADPCAPPGYDPAAEGIPFEVPWSTGFEDALCDIRRTGGFCYADPDASYEIVEAPVHSGRYAAAFSVITDPAKNGWETRCAQQGVLPVEAIFGAWFYIPAPVAPADNWNLFFIQGGAPGDWHGLWDVSLALAEDGRLFLRVYDHLNGRLRAPEAVTSVPIAAWFHVEFRLRRASGATGEVALYQDGVLLLDATGIVTDDSGAAQFYVGNLAKALTPQDSTIYVDDVTIRAP